MSETFRLPSRYRSLLGVLAERSDSDAKVWVGEAGFLRAEPEQDLVEWLEKLDHRRWRGMHPDLVPFATDGAGNQFCFFRNGKDSCRGVRAIVYWMYETYRAVPVASSFDGFLSWLGLTAFVGARKGDDPVLDSSHFDREVAPLLSEVGLEPDFGAVLDEPDPSSLGVHRAMLQLDDEAPASRLAVAMHLAGEDKLLQALDLCAEASFSFPEFAASRFASARLLASEQDSQSLHDALLQTLERPVAYCGDEAMPHFRDVPVVDLDWTAEVLAGHPLVDPDGMEDPIWEIVVHGDAENPAAWVRVAIEQANGGDLERAVTAASNALHFGFAEELGAEILLLLQELYTALGWKRHARVAGREARAPR